jgi:dTDP-4-dehydrorhamnose 3,5-epimerase
MAFQVKALQLEGCYELLPKVHKDERGLFVKTLNEDAFKELGLIADFKEEYFSVSKQNVLRGMHFQVPPHDQVKLVYCIDGTVLDVLLDLRKDSKTFGNSISLELSSSKYNIVYIPQGVAHGFYTLSVSATLVYKTSTVYCALSDQGILWNSFGFVWPASQSILSERDQAHPKFSTFHSPF